MPRLDRRLDIRYSTELLHRGQEGREQHAARGALTADDRSRSPRPRLARDGNGRLEERLLQVVDEPNARAARASPAEEEAQRPRLARAASSARRRSPRACRSRSCSQPAFRGRLGALPGWSSRSSRSRSRLWVVAAKLFGLYRDDEARADHSTLDDLARVFLLVTVGALPFALVTGYSERQHDAGAALLDPRCPPRHDRPRRCAPRLEANAATTCRTP